MKNVVDSSLCFLIEIAPSNIYKCIDLSFESMIKCVSAAFLLVRLRLLLASITHDVELNGNYGLFPPVL